MSDDWRVRADLESGEQAERLVRGLHEHEIEREARAVLGAGLTVSVGERTVFVYANQEEDARRAVDALADVLAEHGLSATIGLDRWHPDEERWEDAGAPLPRTPTERAAELAARERREAAESAERGPQWQLRIDFDSRRDAVEAVRRLEAEGLRARRGFRHVFVRCATEDDARELAERLTREMPLDAELIVEGAPDDAWTATHPFAVLGGIAN